MQVPLQRPVEMYGEHGRFAYHYTTSEAAFEHIVPSGHFRLSSLGRLRDPVENKDWVQALMTAISWPEEDVARFDALTRRVIHETKILSFTLDAPTKGRSPEHARGYARPRMWEQYASNHTGVCLIFDRVALEDCLMSVLPAFNDTIAREVEYSDLPLPGHGKARTLRADFLAADGDGDIEVGLRKHLRSHARELFFRKLEDWVTEREYRFVVLDADPIVIRVAYGNALRAVIVGEQFPEWQIPAAARVCAVAQVELRQIQWGVSPPGVFDPTEPHPMWGES